MIVFEKYYRSFKQLRLESLVKCFLFTLLVVSVGRVWSQNILNDENEEGTDSYVTRTDEIPTKHQENSEKQWLIEPLEKDPKAQYVLGVSYALGDGVPQNDKMAVEWYRLSANQGFADAQYNLAVSYANGRGVIKDRKKARKWYQLAAAQGIPEAQFNLGLGYDDGSGGTQYFKEALKWYRAAAQQGYFKAQVALGRMYADGLGVEQNYVLAYMWTSIGAANGSEVGVLNLPKIRQSMSPREISEAKERARACVRNVYKKC